jgi:hypothetical protein
MMTEEEFLEKIQKGEIGFLTGDIPNYPMEIWIDRRRTPFLTIQVMGKIIIKELSNEEMDLLMEGARWTSLIEQLK